MEGLGLIFIAIAWLCLIFAVIKYACSGNVNRSLLKSMVVMLGLSTFIAILHVLDTIYGISKFASIFKIDISHCILCAIIIFIFSGFMKFICRRCTKNNLFNNVLLLLTPWYLSGATVGIVAWYNKVYNIEMQTGTAVMYFIIILIINIQIKRVLCNSLVIQRFTEPR